MLSMKRFFLKNIFWIFLYNFSNIKIKYLRPELLPKMASKNIEKLIEIEIKFIIFYNKHDLQKYV